MLCTHLLASRRCLSVFDVVFGYVLAGFVRLDGFLAPAEDQLAQFGQLRQRLLLQLGVAGHGVETLQRRRKLAEALQEATDLDVGEVADVVARQRTGSAAFPRPVVAVRADLLVAAFGIVVATPLASFRALCDSNSSFELLIGSTRPSKSIVWLQKSLSNLLWLRLFCYSCFITETE